MSDFESRARQAADAVRREIAGNSPDPEHALRRARQSTARRRAAVPGVIAVVALIAGVTFTLSGNGNNPRSPGSAGTSFALAGALKPFGQCDAVLQYFKDNAPEHLLAQVGGRPGPLEGDAKTLEAPATTTVPSARPNSATSDSSTSSAAGSANPGASQYSSTNVQEAGVDEPDIIKTDGRRIAAVAQGRVDLIEVGNGNPQLRSTLPETNARNIFLDGDRLLVFGQEILNQNQIFDADSALKWSGQQSTMTLYDIADLRSPKTIATLSIDGNVLDARLAGNQVRVATASSPDLDIPSPTYDNNGKVDDRSMSALRAAIAASKVSDWIPNYTLSNSAGATINHGQLVDCEDLARPKVFSGLDTVAITTFDMTSLLDTLLDNQKSIGVIAGGQQVYATANTLYVSTLDWSDNSNSQSQSGFRTPDKTAIHAFSTDASGESVYRGSGEVQGALLNQYSMSEYQGVLRIATTVTARRGWINARTVSEGIVTTLQARDGQLRQVGKVDGLGRNDNESIRAVRFIDDRGYVVTFRQTDPLFVIDLHDPATPKVTGELKIPGYSGYLHPVGKDLILGVGQGGAETATATTTTVTQVDPTPGNGNGASGSSQPLVGSATGVQFSLFDVSNPAAPRRINVQSYGYGAAGAEYDPKAFLYWQPRDLVIAPTNLYGFRGQNAFSGLLLLHVEGSGLKEVGRIPMIGAQNGSVQRTLVIDNLVYLLSSSSLQVNDLDSHRNVGILSLTHFPN